MSPLLVFAICIAAAIAVGFLRSSNLAQPVSACSEAPTPTTRVAPKRAPARPLAGDAGREQPEAA